MRLSALIALMLLVTPAMAADDPLDSAARLFFGLADGAQIEMPGVGRGSVATSGPGGYEAALDKGSIGFTLTQPGPCKFSFDSAFGAFSSSGRADFTGLRDIKLRDLGINDGLNAFQVDFRGPAADLLQMLDKSGNATNVKPAVTFVTSSLTLPEMQAAADAIVALCAKR